MKNIAIGIDVGGTTTSYGVVARDGTTHGEGELDTPAYPTPELFLDALSAGIASLMEKAGISSGEIAGIGIGAPNANYFTGKIENAPNLPWKGVIPLRDMVQERFPGIEVVMTNDAKAAAIGEMTYGGAKSMKDFVVITLGTGLGSGFVSGGRLVLGADSVAGELGHITVIPGGRMCGCGRRGCLETYVSATGIRRTVFELLAVSTRESRFRSVSFDELKAVDISIAADGGDPIAMEAFEETGEMLGRALATAAAITNPEAIFLLGGLSQAGKHIFDPTAKSLEESLLPNFRGRIRLLPSGVKEVDAAILGASSLVWSEEENRGSKS